MAASATALPVRHEYQIVEEDIYDALYAGSAAAFDSSQGVTVTALGTAHAEPTGVPASNETPLEKLGFLFAALRNQVTATTSKKTFHDDSDAAQWEKDLSDDGTTYTETKGNAP